MQRISELLLSAKINSSEEILYVNYAEIFDLSFSYENIFLNKRKKYKEREGNPIINKGGAGLLEVKLKLFSLSRCSAVFLISDFRMQII